MKKHLIFGILLCWFFLIHCATDKQTVQPTDTTLEKCEGPVWDIGDSWRYRYDNNREWEHRVLNIEELKNNKIYIVQDVYGVYKYGVDNQTLDTKFDIGADGKKVLPMTDWGWQYNFPLYVGKKWSKRVTGKSTQGNLLDYDYTYRVISFDNITVPAGTFKAFKIEREQRSTSRSNEYTISYRWYSTEVKREVKFQYGPEVGNWTRSGQGYELKSFKFAKAPEKTQQQKVSSPPIPARTETGKELILNPDGTWKYIYTKPVSAKKYFKTQRGNFGVWYDDNRWVISEKPDEEGRWQFRLIGEDGVGTVIAEGIEAPTTSLKKIVLENAKKAAKDFKIISEENRIVNGREVLCLIFEGTHEQIAFTFYGYYYGGKEGTIQVVTFTGKNLFSKYQQEFTSFLNGLVILKK